MANDTGKGGPTKSANGVERNGAARGGFGGGFSFSDREGRPGGRGGRDERGPRREGGGSSGSQRIVGELSILEKALSKNDFATEKTSLESILKAIRPLRLKSLDGLDFTARGRLLTTLLRVSRQPRPAVTEEVSPAPDAAPTEQAAPEAPAAEASASDAPTEAASTEAALAESAAPEAAPAEGTTSEQAPSEAAKPAAAAPEKEKTDPYTAVMLLIGRIWRAVNDEDRAAKAFEAVGKTLADVPDEKPLEAEAKPAGAERTDRPRRDKDRGDRGARGAGRPERGERGARTGERGPRPERGERGSRGPGARPEAPKRQFQDWKEEAKHLEGIGRTRDAARLFERNKEFADAVRLFEAGGDLRSALRNALSEADRPQVARLLKAIKPAEAAPILERAQAFEVLMELYVQTGEFHQVAGLYERARQFDQAALAWERAGKYSNARKAFERAKDTSNAERVRKLEVEKLIERGDRLGAATVLMGAGKKDLALQVVSAVPSSKAYRFLQQLKMDQEAQELAKRELETAEKENKPGTQARWLEMTGDLPGAASAWERAGRNDKALALHERGQNWKRAAELAEGLFQYPKAIELYRKAGDENAASRVASLPPPPPQAVQPPPPPEEPGAGEGAEAGAQ